MDSAKRHLADEVEQGFSDVNSSIKIIHGRLILLLQFLDTNLNKPFKDIMKERWEDWIENGQAEFPDKGNSRGASYQLVAEWEDDTWKKVATCNVIMNGFCQYCYIVISVLNLELEETVK